MIEKKGEKCSSVFPKAQDDALRCLVLSPTQRYLVYCHSGVKEQGNICIMQLGSGIFFLKNLIKLIHQLLEQLAIT